MIYAAIRQLVEYGLETKLIEADDAIYTTNQLLMLFGLDEYKEETGSFESLEQTLNVCLDYAVEQNLIPGDSIEYRDLFDTKIMGCLMPRPSEVRKKFFEAYKISPKAATDYYYQLSQDSDYIRRYRIKKDMRWITETEYGAMDITINLSKPEKDPKAIALAKLAKQTNYPKCLLCKENEGYAGRIGHPARQNHRVIPITINEQEWFFQYSPYVYYNEHCIVFRGEHEPMRIDKSAFRKLLDFVKLFPHYFVGSNADLPIVGGSILSHDHFQGGNYEFAMERAEIEKSFEIPGFEGVTAGIVKWPMSVIRLQGEDDDQIIELADHILTKWRAYSDEEADIFAFTDEEPHNTITPIARRKNGKYELDLVLRNNRTTNEHPLGLFHPHEELHHIKKENIGLIEVMGLAVLPARLKQEMTVLKESMLNGSDIRSNDAISKHADWAEMIQNKYEQLNESNIDEVIQTEIGLVFKEVLLHAGVYKRDKKGQQSFEKFIRSL